MKAKSLWDERLGMLMASGSPGSALAYHLGQTTFDSMMVRRNTATYGSEAEGRPMRLEAPALESPKGLIARVRKWFHEASIRLETWSWQRQMREHEAFLAQATDLADLEARMRRLDGDPFLSRARALR